jgi:predicted GIY-YIG superfamily endonuclease
MPWFMYILKCSDRSYYTGHTQDLRLRVKTHNEGRGPLYTVMRRPVELAYWEEAPSRAEAVKRERQVKKWSRAKKEALISWDLAALKLSSQCHSKKPKASC